MDDHESNKKILFSNAMRGEWSKVIEMYTQDPMLHNSRITRSGHTALHIAVSEGKDDVVKQMVDIMWQKQPSKQELVNALRTHNQRKNTTLHVAASMGNARICHIIATVEHTLVDDRNVDGETPLFLAALHGRKQAFICLHFIRNPPPHASDPPFTGNCRRNNGDTILHSAIKGDYFDLAFQIILLYKDHLANSMNEEGLSPLHLLASKPSAFRSGSRLGRMETLIYNCIHVEELKEENPTDDHRNKCPSGGKDGDSSHDHPENYNTLWNIFHLIRKAVTAVVAAHEPVVEAADAENPGTRGSRVAGGRTNPLLFPINYETCCNLIRFFYLVLMVSLGKGYEDLRKIYRKKETHTWCSQIVKQLLNYAASYEYEDDGTHPQEGYSTTSSEEDTLATSVKPTNITEDKKDEKNPKRSRMESPVLVAAKNGVMEIIERIVGLFPVAIHDLNEDKKNIVLLAVEHRQPHVYQFLLKKNIYKESLFHQLDKDGNSVLHLAATLRDEYKPWLIPGEALQMQWELKWYKFVNEPMPPDFFGRYNNENETPDDVFSRTHNDLTKRAAEWLNKTSESCSLVAALIATVAFATAATVPGGFENTGHPALEDRPEFQLFAISSLVALGCSITAMVMFLSILTSRFQEQDFNKSLPRKLLVGLTSLFMSITSMLVSFCAGHFFVLRDKLHYVALPIYLVTCLPVTLFVLAQFPLYFDLLRATFKHVPQRSYRSAP